jgi:hypothetical protein
LFFATGSCDRLYCSRENFTRSRQRGSALVIRSNSCGARCRNFHQGRQRSPRITAVFAVLLDDICRIHAVRDILNPRFGQQRFQFSRTGVIGSCATSGATFAVFAGLPNVAAALDPRLPRSNSVVLRFHPRFKIEEPQMGRVEHIHTVAVRRTENSQTDRKQSPDRQIEFRNLITRR